MILAHFIQETPVCEEEVGKSEGIKELKDKSRGNRWSGRNTGSNSTLFIIVWGLSPPTTTKQGDVFSSKTSLGGLITAIWDHGRFNSIILLSDKSLEAVTVFPRCMIQTKLWYRSNLTWASGGQNFPISWCSQLCAIPFSWVWERAVTCS